MLVIYSIGYNYSLLFGFFACHLGLSRHFLVDFQKNAVPRARIPCFRFLRVGPIDSDRKCISSGLQTGGCVSSHSR